eukprot:864401-Rhodomonas_salina.2
MDLLAKRRDFAQDSTRFVRMLRRCGHGPESSWCKEKGLHPIPLDRHVAQLQNLLWRDWHGVGGVHQSERLQVRGPWAGEATSRNNVVESGSQKVLA